MSSKGPYLVTGAATGVYPRLEIRDLIKEQKQFTLFILAWNAISQSGYIPEAASYVEQAGIHGMPYRVWGGDPDVQQPELDENDFQGYCNHSSVLFPTWHRPSIMLIEQSISEEARKQAEAFAGKHPEEADDWRVAAQQLRFPYWDWTKPEEDLKFPRIFLDPKVPLYHPQGEIKPIDNPLCNYKFVDAPLLETFKKQDEKVNKKKKKTDPPSRFGEWKQTYRWPTDSADPMEQIDGINKEFNAQQDPDSPESGGSWLGLAHQVQHLFLYPANLKGANKVYAWDLFSNKAVMSHRDSNDPTKMVTWNWDVAGDFQLNGIEQVHDAVHDIIGGGGHMSNLDYASYDPIFFLHHCNVDRIIALWEQVYPNYYLETQHEGGYKDQDVVTQQFRQNDIGKFGWKDLKTVDLKNDTPLTPFRKDDGTYWTSDDARWGSTVAKNYRYDDLTIGGEILDPLRPKLAPVKFKVEPGHTTQSNLRQLVADNQLVAAQDIPVHDPRSCLQKLFGFNPVLSRQKAYEVLGESRKLVYPPSIKPLSEDYEAIHDYRHFILRLNLNSHALGCSYSVKIGFKALDPNGQTTFTGRIGSASVLARFSDTKCGACQGQRAAGLRSTYTIAIPHGIIAKLAVHSGDMEVVPLLLKSLTAEIALSGNVPVANTFSESAEPFPGEKVPEVTLHSAALQAKHDGVQHVTDEAQDHTPFTPIETYDWQCHGTLFPAQTWAAVYHAGQS